MQTGAVYALPGTPITVVSAAPLRFFILEDDGDDAPRESWPSSFSLPDPREIERIIIAIGDDDFLAADALIALANIRWSVSYGCNIVLEVLRRFGQFGVYRVPNMVTKPGTAGCAWLPTLGLLVDARVVTQLVAMGAPDSVLCAVAASRAWAPDAIPLHAHGVIDFTLATLRVNHPHSIANALTPRFAAIHWTPTAQALGQELADYIAGASQWEFLARACREWRWMPSADAMTLLVAGVADDHVVLDTLASMLNVARRHAPALRSFANRTGRTKLASTIAWRYGNSRPRATRTSTLLDYVEVATH